MAAAVRVANRRIRRSAAAPRNTNRSRNRNRRNKNNRNNNAAAAAAAAAGGRKRGRPRAAHPGVLILPVPSRNPLDLNFPLLRGIMDPLAIRYLFKKELKFSDVSAAHRIVIPKKCAEAYLPKLDEKEGFFLNMDDIDGTRVWCFKFRYWPNNHSRMYLLEYTGEFVETHALSLGDFIYIFKDDRNNRFVIEAHKCSPPRTTTINLNNEAVAAEPAPYFPNMPPIIHDDYFMGDSAMTATFGDFPTAAISGGALPEMPALERVSSFGSLTFNLEDFP